MQTIQLQIKESYFLSPDGEGKKMKNSPRKIRVPLERKQSKGKGRGSGGEKNHVRTIETKRMYIVRK